MAQTRIKRRRGPEPETQSLEQGLRRQMAWASGTEQFQHRDPLYHVTESFQQTFDAMGRRHVAELGGGPEPLIRAALAGVSLLEMPPSLQPLPGKIRRRFPGKPPAF